MSIFDEFEKRTAGIWLTPKNVVIGETYTIRVTSIDDKMYPPKVYFICDCTADAASKHRDKGSDCKARLGPERYEDVKAVLEEDWIGNKLKVVRIKDYKGLAQPGIIWEGVKEDKQERPAPSPSQPKGAFEVSDEVKIWLLTNKGVIGQPIPPDLHNATDKAIFKELEEVGLFYFKDFYPCIHPDAAQVIE